METALPPISDVQLWVHLWRADMAQQRYVQMAQRPRIVFVPPADGEERLIYHLRDAVLVQYFITAFVEPAECAVAMVAGRELQFLPIDMPLTLLPAGRSPDRPVIVVLPARVSPEIPLGGARHPVCAWHSAIVLTQRRDCCVRVWIAETPPEWLPLMAQPLPRGYFFRGQGDTRGIVPCVRTTTRRPPRVAHVCAFAHARGRAGRHRPHL